MRVDAIHTHDLLDSESSVLSSKKNCRYSARSSRHHYHHHAGIMRCPHHVPLPNSYWDQDNRDLQIGIEYQVSTKYTHMD